MLLEWLVHNDVEWEVKDQEAESVGVIQFSVDGLSVWMVTGRKDVRVPEEYSGQRKRFLGRKMMFTWDQPRGACLSFAFWFCFTENKFAVSEEWERDSRSFHYGVVSRRVTRADLLGFNLLGNAFLGGQRPPRLCGLPIMKAEDAVDISGPWSSYQWQQWDFCAQSVCVCVCARACVHVCMWAHLRVDRVAWTFETVKENKSPSQQKFSSQEIKPPITVGFKNYPSSCLSYKWNNRYKAATIPGTCNCSVKLLQRPPTLLGTVITLMGFSSLWFILKHFCISFCHLHEI